MKPLPTKILIVEDCADDNALLVRQPEKANLHTQVRTALERDDIERGESCARLVPLFAP